MPLVCGCTDFWGVLRAGVGVCCGSAGGPRGAGPTAPISALPCARAGGPAAPATASGVVQQRRARLVFALALANALISVGTSSARSISSSLYHGDARAWCCLPVLHRLQHESVVGGCRSWAAAMRASRSAPRAAAGPEGPAPAAIRPVQGPTGPCRPARRRASLRAKACTLCEDGKDI